MNTSFVEKHLLNWDHSIYPTSVEDLANNFVRYIQNKQKDLKLIYQLTDKGELVIASERRNWNAIGSDGLGFLEQTPIIIITNFGKKDQSDYYSNLHHYSDIKLIDIPVVH